MEENMEYEKYMECVDVVCLHCTELSEKTCQNCPVRITYKKLSKHTQKVNADE